MEARRWRGRGVLSALCLMAVGAQPALAQEPALPEGLVMFDFEEGLAEWVIPEWAMESTDYVGKELLASKDFASNGEGAAQLLVDFPGQGKWTGGYVEIEMHVVDWTPFSELAADVYLPYNVPSGLKGRLILTVGDKWEWTEMNRPVALKPDQWTTVKANLKPGSMDWKFFPDENFRKDIRKVGIRLESDRAPAYKGPVFIDNIRLIK